MEGTVCYKPRLPYGLSQYFRQKIALSYSTQVDGIAGVRNAVAALYETHFERVARYIAVRVGQVDEAQDLASEVFVRALRSAESYKETGAPMEAWIFKIAHNMVVDHLRKRGRRPASIPLDDAPPLTGKENPTEAIERKQAADELHKAMQSLSDSQRQVLALRFGSEMSAEEVAKIMGKNAGAVREMQSAAVKKLRTLMRNVR